MRAMVLEEPRPAEQHPLQERDLPLPAPGRGEIRVRVRACGVCHTDLHTVEGEIALPKLPVVPGHQVAGVVEARGAGADRFREGDRVGVPWLYWTCGACRFCVEGRENLCDAHNEGGNLIFVDGHAEYRKYRRLRSGDFGLLPDELYQPTRAQTDRDWQPAF